MDPEVGAATVTRIASDRRSGRRRRAPFLAPKRQVGAAARFSPEVDLEVSATSLFTAPRSSRSAAAAPPHRTLGPEVSFFRHESTPRAVAPTSGDLKTQIETLGEQITALEAKLTQALADEAAAAKDKSDADEKDAAIAQGQRELRARRIGEPSERSREDAVDLVFGERGVEPADEGVVLGGDGGRGLVRRSATYHPGNAITARRRGGLECAE